MPPVVKRFGAKRVMIMASRTLNRETPAVVALREALGDAHAVTVDEIGAHSPRPNVMHAVGQARAAQADVLVSVGGGSVVDACKAVQFCLDAGIETAERLLRHGRFSDGTRGELAGHWQPEPGRRRIPHVAVPTTLSAAEFSDNAGLTDPERGIKEGYRTEGLCPRVILYDPALSRHTPLWLQLKRLFVSLELPVSLHAVGVEEPFLDAIADAAVRHPVVRNNPRPVSEAGQVREILELAKY